MPEQICGIHLGGEALLAVNLQLDKRTLTLLGGAVIPLDAQAHMAIPLADQAAPAPDKEEEEAPPQDGHELIPSLRRAARDLHLAKRAPVAFSLPKQQGILRNVVLPATDPDELDQMARFETERHIPFHQERHCTGYHLMRELGVEGSEVLLGAVDGPVIDRALGAAAGAGFDPRGLTLSSLALVNAVLHVRRAALAEKTVGILNLGLDALDLVLLTDTRVRFARSVGNDLRGVLQTWAGGAGESPRNLAADKLALLAKSIDCMDLEARYHPESAGAAASSEGPEQVRAWIQRVMQEVRRTYDFARREMKCPPIELLMITGEGAALRHLPEYIQQNLTLAVEVVNPLACFDNTRALKLPFDGLELALPFGAALGPLLQEGYYQLDLVPDDYYRHQTRQQTLRKALLTGGLALVTIGLVFAAWTHHQNIDAESFMAFNRLNEQMSEKVGALKEMQTQLRLIRNFQGDPNAALTVFANIAASGILPGPVSLTTIQYEKGGVVELQGDAKTVPDINRFMDDLRATGHFAEPMEMTSDPGTMFNQPLYRFKIDAPLTKQETRPATREEQAK